jgi:hypothetical protein
MQVLATLFTEIFVGTGLFVHNTHTATVLPHFTQVTLNEHAANIVRQDARGVGGRESRLGGFAAATEGFTTRGRQARIVLRAAETSGDFFLLILFGVIFVLFARWIGEFVVAGALALPRVWEVIFRAVFAIVDGLGPLTRRSLRRRAFMVRPGTSVPRHGLGGAGGVDLLEEGRRRLGKASSGGATRGHGGGKPETLETDTS